MAVRFEDTDNDDLIHRYTRAQAIADGALIDVSSTAREAGIHYSVAQTAAVWQKCVAVPPGVLCQDEAGRLRDVLGVLGLAARRTGVRPAAPRQRAGAVRLVRGPRPLLASCLPGRGVVAVAPRGRLQGRGPRTRRTAGPPGYRAGRPRSLRRPRRRSGASKRAAQV
jgi:hypothetical protein